MPELRLALLGNPEIARGGAALAGLDQVAEPGAPFLLRAAVGNVAARVEPERAVARVEADTPHLGPGLA